jgi:ABC-type spermidine/putrescine transport system permease subunit I
MRLDRLPRWLSLREPYLLLIPVGCLLLPFFVLPLGILIRNSVYRDVDAGLMVPDFTLVNYIKVTTDPFYVTTYLNTFGIALVVATLALVLGYPFAYFLVRYARRSRNLLVWLIYTPLTVSIIVRTFGWVVITADTGVVNNVLIAIGAVERPLRILFEVEGMTVGMVHRYLPLMVLPIVNSLSKIDSNLYRAGRTLGAGEVRIFWTVTVPLSLPGIVAGMQLVLAGVLSDFVLPTLLGTTKFRMLAPAIYDEAVGRFSWANASAMTMTMVGLMFAVLLTTAMVTRRAAPWSRAL